MPLKKKTPAEKTELNTKEELTNLLKRKLPAVFEREPAPAYTNHLDTLVDEIIALFEE